MKKRRQHYVPKFYLRNFSQNDNSISTFNITNSKYIKNASVKNMCQRNNFYGDDAVVEEFLDIEIERRAAKIIKRIIDTNTIPDFETEFEEYEHLIAFLLVTEGRNLKSADSADHFADTIAKVMLEEHPDFNEIELDKFSVKLNHPANQTIGIALSSTPLVLDLQPVIIVHKTSRKFITSDNPLIRYNNFYIQRNYHGRGSGYATRGLQLFFPISSEKCLLLYDSLIYDIPDKVNHTLFLNKAREVDYLNELFYLNAYNNVFFSERIKEDYIRKIYLRNRNTPKVSDLEREVQFFNSTESDGQLISITNNRVTKKIKLPWIKYSKFAKELPLPAHMGGLQRIESPFIRDYMDK
ncbi:hypothetical protein BN988_02866 [Oceanobacillus picturae]|uniref:DUF4238 domain-containing protein n=1 Tax=Oceanobacillus picturae TaxID=171693 RepID=W9AN24_9BACI|nr:DUF4238 domain-containing protein [Oceanobacillus picturae]CDO04312.1 hypothetical protein BN988_02866 [Oceanobacillus picturae]